MNTRRYLSDCLGLNKIDRNCHIAPGSYDASKLSQGDRNWLFNYFGHSGEAPVGYGGESVGGSSGSSPPTIDPIAQAQKLRQFNIESNQPAITSLEQSIPETRQRFSTVQASLEAEKTPLKERYNLIIGELSNRESKDITGHQRRTGQEFGYRGIPASSTLYTDEINRGESGIRQNYGGKIRDVGLEREGALRGIDTQIGNLAGQSVDAERTIQNAIGLLRSGDPASALSGAMSILNLQQQQSQFTQSQSQQESQFTRQQALSEREFGLKSDIAGQPDTSVVNIGGRAKLINTKTGAVIQDLGMSGDPKTGTSEERLAGTKSSLLSEAGQGATLAQLTKKFGGSIGLPDIVKLYTAVSPHGTPHESWALEILGLNSKPTGGNSSTDDSSMNAWLERQGIIKK